MLAHFLPWLWPNCGGTPEPLQTNVHQPRNRGRQAWSSRCVQSVRGTWLPCADGLPPKMRRQWWHTLSERNHHASGQRQWLCPLDTDIERHPGASLTTDACRRALQCKSSPDPRGGASCSVMATRVKWQATPAVSYARTKEAGARGVATRGFGTAEHQNGSATLLGHK